MLGSSARTLPALSVSASKSASAMLVTLVNQLPSQTVEVALRIEGARAAGAQSRLLSGPSARAQNTFDQPDLVTAKPAQVSLQDGGIRLTLPPHSVQAVQIRLG
jgi:alpha-L-arabinofuranosidase